MPLTGTGPILGLALAAASGSIDPAGIAAWIGVASAICSWLPGNTTVNPGSMTGSGGAVTGAGALAFSSVPTFGTALAAGAGSNDAKGIERWTAIGTTITSHLASFGSVNPSGLAYPDPAGGPVTGTGLLVFPDPSLGPSMAVAAGSIDPVGIVSWTLFGTVLEAYLIANTLVLPLPIGLAVAPGGGPVLGSGSIQ